MSAITSTVPAWLKMSSCPPATFTIAWFAMVWFAPKLIVDATGLAAPWGNTDKNDPVDAFVTVTFAATPVAPAATDPPVTATARVWAACHGPDTKHARHRAGVPRSGNAATTASATGADPRCCGQGRMGSAQK